MKFKCPHCGTKYDGPRCPNCRRITDSDMRKERMNKIVIISFIVFLIVVAILLSIPWIVAKISMDKVAELTGDLSSALQDLF